MVSGPLVSVIMPLYNAADYVLRSVASVFGQSFQDFEIVVVDDGSTDGGADRLREAYGTEPRLRVLAQANAGVSAARNRGLAEMRGEMAAFLDADDEWLPTHLEDIVETARRFPSAGVLGTGYRLICRGGYTSEVGVSGDEPTLVTDYFRAAKAARFSSLLHISACAVTRQAYEALGGFLENEPYGEDVEFEARYALRFPVACHPRVTTVYHRDVPTSAMANFAGSWSGDLPLLVRRYPEWAAANAADPDTLRSLERYAAFILYNTAALHIGLGSRAGVAELLSHPLLQSGETRLRARLAAWLAGGFLRPAARFYYRFTRSRLFHRSFVADGVRYRCISRFAVGAAQSSTGPDPRTQVEAQPRV